MNWCVSGSDEDGRLRADTADGCVSEEVGWRNWKLHLYLLR